MNNFAKWINTVHSDTNVFGADSDEVHSWLTQKFEPGNRPQIMFKGTQYQVIGEPNDPQARGNFVQIRPIGARHGGADKSVPIKSLLAAVIP
jgi:hypothetical protein